MKKLKILTIALAIILSMGACSSNDSGETVSDGAVTTKTQNVQAEVKNGETPAEEMPAEETVEDKTEAVEFVEPAADEFEYKYDAALKGVIITEYKGEATAIRIPREIEGDPVVVVGEMSYENTGFSYRITDIELHDGIIGMCFRNCTHLENVTIPSSITTLDNFAFYNCEALKSFVIPDNITEIGDSVFCHCTGLESIVIPDSVIKIGDNAFETCMALTDITISDNVAEIGVGAFANCKALEKIKLPENLEIISGDTFSKCENLKDVALPDGLKEIHGFAFEKCTKMRSLTLPDNIESVGETTFIGCDGLTVTYKGNEYNYSTWLELREAIHDK